MHTSMQLQLVFSGNTRIIKQLGSPHGGVFDYVLPDMWKMDTAGLVRGPNGDDNGSLHAFPAFGHWMTIPNSYRLSYKR